MALPKLKSVVTELDKITTKPSKREYLGYSQLGDACERHVWYSYRWAYNFVIPAQVMRIFERGDLEEARVIKGLESIGCTVIEEQKEVVGIERHVLGHIDGTVRGVPGAEETNHLLEIKTAKAAVWKRFVKQHLKAANYKYYCQMQSYMGKLKLQRGLFICVNKDTEEWYEERVYFDKEVYEQLERKAFKILSTEEPPKKAFAKTWWACKICNYFPICHDNEPIAQNCRTCASGTIDKDGTWTCAITEKILTKQEQIDGCDKYEQLW